MPGPLVIPPTYQPPVQYYLTYRFDNSQKPLDIDCKDTYKTPALITLTRVKDLAIIPVITRPGAPDPTVEELENAFPKPPTENETPDKGTT